MTLGIAIPTYINHLGFLNQLLDSLEQSTVLPNQVSISISSFDGELNLKDYSFEIIISKTKDRQNPCQNRNIAASKLNTDIISFLDGDDISHIKRNEFLISSFENGSNAVVHNYTMNKDRNSLFYKNNINDIIFYKDYINGIFPNCPFPKNINHKDYACGHASFTKELFDKFKYNESIGWIPGEDGEILKRIVSNNIPISYIENKLSHYIK
jgi:hypothetical protein